MKMTNYVKDFLHKEEIDPKDIDQKSEQQKL